MSTNTTKHVYEIILNTTPEGVWRALTDGKVTEKYFFGSRVESKWTAGSSYRYVDTQGTLSSDGKIVEIDPQSHLKMTWVPAWLPGTAPSTLSWDLQALDSLTLLTLTHSDIDDATFDSAGMHVGWIFVLSSMKTLLETGKAMATPAALAG